MAWWRKQANKCITSCLPPPWPPLMDRHLYTISSARALPVSHSVAASATAHTAPGPHGPCVLCHDFRSHAVRLWDECLLSSHSAILHFNILCPKFQFEAITRWILSKTLNIILGMYTFFLFLFHRKAQNLEWLPFSLWTLPDLFLLLVTH